MKSNFLYFYFNKILILILLISLINSFLSNSGTLKNSKDANNTRRENASRSFDDFMNYFDILGKIFEVLDKKCFNDLKNEFDKTIEQKDVNYPWIIDYVGKSLNDIGDEIECNNSLINTTFIITKINTFAFSYQKDLDLLNYLDVDRFIIGVCVMDNCLDSFEFYFKKLLLLISYILNNNATDYEKKIVDYEPEPKKIFKYKFNIFIICVVYLIIKFIVGISSLILIPKGYEKYVAGLLDEQKNLENIDIEEKKEFFPKERHESTESTSSEETDYSFDDLESYIPIKLKIFKFFDFFNDFKLLITKKNRYFDERGLEIITLMRAIVIFFMIFVGTFNTVVSLPSRDITTKTFFNSLFLSYYKLSINSLTCWIVLEGAYTTYKLMCFIKAQILESYINTKKRPKIEIKLLIIYAKFLLHFIPKIFLFFIIYYIFYYNVEDFNVFLDSVKTFTYIMNNIFKKNITCDGNPLRIFNFNIFSNNYSDYKNCYEFTYIYFNIFLCTFVFMIIIYLSFVIRNKIFEILIILINIIFFFISMILIKDDQVTQKLDKNKKYMPYKFYHFLGQNYSTRIFFSLIGFYHLGYILGFLIFHYENNKYEFKSKLKKKNESIEPNEIILNNNKKDINNLNGNLENAKLSEDLNIEDINNKNSENNKEFIINYYPLSFFNTFLFWMYKVSSSIKLLIILICLFFLFVLSISFQIYLKTKDDFNYEINYFVAKNYFIYEKHIFIIFFFIINFILITYPKTKYFKSIINSPIFIGISRTGFTITCLYYFLSYFFFCSFFIKVKFHIPTLIFLSLGNFLFIYFTCFLINLIVELPLRIGIKKLLRNKSKRK